MQAFSTGKHAIAADIKEQKKKKTIYTAELPFPFVKTRLLVVKKREV